MPESMNMKWAASPFTKPGREQKHRIVFQGIHLHMVILLDNLVPPGKEFYSVSYNDYYFFFKCFPREDLVYKGILFSAFATSND